MPHPWQTPSRFVRQSAPDPSVGYLIVSTSTLLPLEQNIVLTQCWSCPRKATNLPFPPETVSVGSTKEKLGPGTSSGAASGCLFQRAGILNKPRASPSVTKQLGVWYHPETPSPPHVLMQASVSDNGETRRVFIRHEFCLCHTTGSFYWQWKTHCSPCSVRAFAFHLSLWFSQMFLSSWCLLGHKYLGISRVTKFFSPRVVISSKHTHWEQDHEKQRSFPAVASWLSVYHW